MARLLGQLFHITETFEMEAQPQLLLLQKTMLVAEGTGRKLSPGTNMWLLTRPLIEGWVQDALGPEARLAEAAFEMSETMRRLPRLLDDVEEGAAALAQGRLKLHPETVRALRGEAGKGTLSLPLWAAVLIALLLLVLIF